MKNFLRVKLPNQFYSYKDIDLDIVKKHHTDFIAQINEKNFGIKQDCLKTARRLTEIMFSDHDYILNWATRNLNWDLFEKELEMINPLFHEDWIEADKTIVKK